MKKRFLIGIMLLAIVFIAFVAIKEATKKYNNSNDLKNNLIKNDTFIKN